jgi:branched-subunit amino acid ABC-type transport system permease component
MLVSSALISGLGLGSMYGLLALGFHVTYAASNRGHHWSPHDLFKTAR